MTMNGKILSCVYEALDEGNEERREQGLPPLDKSPATPIHGTESGFDSLSLINFVIAVEEGLERDFGVPIMLSDDRALSQEPSPFETIQTLVAYIEALLNDHQKSGLPQGKVG
jgi:acyl carrier protein